MKRKVQIVIVGIISAYWLVISPAQAHAPTQNVMKEVIREQIHTLAPKHYAKVQMEKYEWGAAQFKCLEQLWTRESNWNHLSDNPKSSAFGIAQMLKEKSKNPYRQIDNGLRYIEKRYSSPCRAWSFWQRKYWY